jgi:hypothetical protein
MALSIGEWLTISGLILAGSGFNLANVIKLESAKFSVRHFDKMPKSLALKAFQRL